MRAALFALAWPLVVTRDGAGARGSTSRCFDFGTRALLRGAGGVAGLAGAACWGGVRGACGEGLLEAALALRGAGGVEGTLGARWRGGVLGAGRLGGALRGVLGGLGVRFLGGVFGERGEKGERFGEGFGFFDGVLCWSSSSSSEEEDDVDESDENLEPDQEESVTRSTKSTFLGDLGDGVAPVRSITFLPSAERFRLRSLEAAGGAPFL